MEKLFCQKKKKKLDGKTHFTFQNPIFEIFRWKFSWSSGFYEVNRIIRRKNISLNGLLEEFTYSMMKKKKQQTF